MRLNRSLAKANHVMVKTTTAPWNSEIVVGSLQPQSRHANTLAAVAQARQACQNKSFDERLFERYGLTADVLFLL